MDPRFFQTMVSEDGTIVVPDQVAQPGEQVFAIRLDAQEPKVADILATIVTYGSTRPPDSYHDWYRQMSAYLDVLELALRGDLGNHNMDDWLYDENGLPR